MRILNMRILTWISLVGMAALVLCNSSCRALTAGTSVVSYPGTQITTNSRLVRKCLKVIQAKVVAANEGVNGLMKVEIDAVSTKRKALQFEYRFRWMDKNNMEVEAGMAGWTTVNVAARDTVHMQAVAPTPKAINYEFLVRLPDRL